jgi:sec-independent protein translocase protein TatB
VFGIGLAELAVIALVAVVVFGPERLPEFARQAGRFLHRLKIFATGARDDLRSELGPEFADLELRDLDPRTIVRKHVMEAMEEASAEAAESSRPRRYGLRPLGEGEVPPYDAEAT